MQIYMACRVCHQKTYKLTHFTDKFRSCLNKLYRNEKLLSVAGQIVMYKDGRCLDKPDRIAKT